MQKIEVTLETVTPMFLRGADPNGQPELRPPAFRGMMRYWFRATLGGVIGDKKENLADLDKLESAVFGNTESGSPITIRRKEISPLKTSLHYILPHKGGTQKWAFDAGQSFQIILQASPRIPPLVFVNACMAFNLAILLGGIGLRSRRGAGSLAIVNAVDENGEDADAIPNAPQTKKGWIRYVKIIGQSAFGYATQFNEAINHQKKQLLPHAPTQFPSASNLAIVRIVDNIQEGSGEAVQKRLMERMIKADYLGGISPRQASPLWARVIMFDDSYHLLLSLLPSKLKSFTDYDAVKKFLDKNFPGEDIPIKGWNTND